MGVYWVASNSVSLLGEVSCRGGGGCCWSNGGRWRFNVEG